MARVGVQGTSSIAVDLRKAMKENGHEVHEYRAISDMLVAVGLASVDAGFVIGVSPYTMCVLIP